MTFISLIPPIYANVMQYGALGNGTGDDGPAIQSAINAVPSGGGTVFLPAGTYNIGTGLSLPGKVQLLGAGWNTILQANNSFNGYIITLAPAGTPTYYCFGASICDMLIYGNCTNQTSGGGIDGYGAVHCRFAFLNIDSCYEAAIKLHANADASFGHHNKIHNCLISGGSNSSGDGCGISIISNDENFIYTNDFEGMGGSGSHSYGIYDTVGLQLIHGNVFVNGKTAIRQENTANGSRIIGNMFDGCSYHGIDINNCSRSVITGNYFDSMGSASANTYSCLEVSFGSHFLTIANNVFRSHGTNGQTKYLLEIVDSGSGGSNTIANNTFIQQGTLGTGVIYLGNSYSGTQVIGNNFPSGTSVSGLSGSIAGSYIKNNVNLNPIGSVTAPSFPATTVAASNTTGYDVTAYITNGTGAITQVQIAGANGTYTNTNYQITASGWGAVHIPNGGSVKFTYGSGAPTWTWMGN